MASPGPLRTALVVIAVAGACAPASRDAAPARPRRATPTPSAWASPPGATTELTRLPIPGPVVALTFDAGGDAAGAERILAALGGAGVRATFFLTGRWAQRFPELARRVAATHRVGNHTADHPHLTRLGDEEVRGQVCQAEAAIRAVTGHDPRPLFRFPFGDRDPRTLAIVAALGYRAIGWTVDSLGWQGRPPGQVVQRVLQRVVPGAIVLMHVGAARDGSTSDADALPAIITALRERGYRFLTVDEGMGAGAARALRAPPPPGRVGCGGGG